MVLMPCCDQICLKEDAGGGIQSSFRLAMTLAPMEQLVTSDGTC